MRILRAVHRAARLMDTADAVAGSQEERAMNAPVILDRRRVLAGGGALIVSFSLTNAFAQDQSTPAAPARAETRPAA